MDNHEKRLRDALAALKAPSREMVEYLGDLATDAIRAAREEGRREGFERAREMAAALAYSRGPMGRGESEYDRMARDIRAMRDVAGESRNRCHAGQDGDCSWTQCPQSRDNEPERSGRHCPLDVRSDDE
jgi:hypothetical protein